MGTGADVAVQTGARAGSAIAGDVLTVAGGVVGVVAGLAEIGFCIHGLANGSDAESKVNHLISKIEATAAKTRQLNRADLANKSQRLLASCQALRDEIIQHY